MMPEKSKIVWVCDTLISRRLQAKLPIITRFFFSLLSRFLFGYCLIEINEQTGGILSEFFPCKTCVTFTFHQILLEKWSRDMQREWQSPTDCATMGLESRESDLKQMSITINKFAVWIQINDSGWSTTPIPALWIMDHHFQ